MVWPIEEASMQLKDESNPMPALQNSHIGTSATEPSVRSAVGFMS